MTLTPQEIQTQEFHVRFRGFDVEEVDGFLEKVAADFLALIEENKKLTAELETLSQEMATHRSQEKTFQHAILSAQQIADEMKEKSRVEADELLNEARREADGLRESANAEISALETEVDRLERLRSEAKNELRRMLDSYIAMVDQPLPPRAAMAEPSEALVPPVAEAAPMPLAPEDSTEETEEEEDFSDLYQRIELPDEDSTTIIRQAFTSDTEGADSTTEAELPPEPRVAVDQPPLAAIPDLDDEIIFSLEDPLDRQEPSVTFDDLEEDGKK